MWKFIQSTVIDIAIECIYFCWKTLDLTAERQILCNNLFYQINCHFATSILYKYFLSDVLIIKISLIFSGSIKSIISNIVKIWASYKIAEKKKFFTKGFCIFYKKISRFAKSTKTEVCIVWMMLIKNFLGQKRQKY